MTMLGIPESTEMVESIDCIIDGAPVNEVDCVGMEVSPSDGTFDSMCSAALGNSLYVSEDAELGIMVGDWEAATRALVMQNVSAASMIVV